jgi:alpha-tubulin suppressor-like RCC1 family protein
MNIANLILQVKDQLSANPADQQALSKALKLLEVGAVQRVARFVLLPSAALNTGKLYYVDFDGLYWSTGQYWTPIARTNESFIWGWGCNTSFELGNRTCINTSSPVSAITLFNDWCQISAGENNVMAIRANGTAWGWGANGGKLGDNSSFGRCSPVSVTGGFTDWCQISAGCVHTLAVRSNGTAWAWGCNTVGQLANLTTLTQVSPVLVVGGFTDWCMVAAGDCFSVGLRSNGTIWAWGRNLCGTLGDNTTVSKSSPVSVVGGFTDWCQVSAGRCHAAALRNNGTLWGWGLNSFGSLGNNTSTNQSSPVSVVGGFTDWCQVSVGDRHTLALRSNGTLWAWGQNTCNQLGDTTSTNRSSPVSVVGGFTNWCQVSAGKYFSIALRTNGTIWGWGQGGSGRLGDGTTTVKSSPVSVIGGFTDWSRVSAGSGFTMAIRNTTL